MKRRRLDQKHQDLINQLPDDILIAIISHLNVKEATTTSILSSRWRYLSTYLTRLNFPSFIPKFKTKKEIVPNEILMIRSFPHNTNTINRVLDSHKGRRVKEFRVHMYGMKGANINRWLEFALAKDVEIIHIHMDYANHKYMDVRGHYSLRENLNLMEETLICLKELSVLGIDVNDEDIQLLLDKFPLLESLSITNSYVLKQVSIVGHSSSKLKHLEIHSLIKSYNLRHVSIEIDNFENLVSIWCDFNIPFSLDMKNVPKLSELSMSDISVCTTARILSEMSSSIHDQLRTLKIFTDPLCTHGYMQGMPQLIGVKNLELKYCSDKAENLYSFNPFYIIQACPSLEKLEVKFSFEHAWRIKVNKKYQEDVIFDSTMKKVCPNLKRMKISGFIGSSSELEYIFAILKNVGTLEELVVERYDEGKKRNRELACNLAQRIFQQCATKVVVV